MTIVKARVWTANTVRLTVGEVVVPFVALAALVTDPSSRSARVIEYDAVQVIEARGASVAVAGQLVVALSSATLNGPASVTLPVFVTR